LQKASKSGDIENNTLYNESQTVLIFLEQISQKQPILSIISIQNCEEIWLKCLRNFPPHLKIPPRYFVKSEIRHFQQTIAVGLLQVQGLTSTTTKAHVKRP